MHGDGRQERYLETRSPLYSSLRYRNKPFGLVGPIGYNAVQVRDYFSTLCAKGLILYSVVVCSSCLLLPFRKNNYCRGILISWIRMCAFTCCLRRQLKTSISNVASRFSLGDVARWVKHKGPTQIWPTSCRHCSLHVSCKSRGQDLPTATVVIAFT